MGNRPANYSDLVQQIDQDALVDTGFRKKLTKVDPNTDDGQKKIHKALTDRYTVTIPVSIKIFIHEDTNEEIHIVLSPKNSNDGSY